MVRLPRFLMAASAVLGALVAAGCRTTQTDFPTNYVPPPPAVGVKACPLPVAVSVFDESPREMALCFDPNADPRLLIPFWPYTKLELSPVPDYTMMAEDSMSSVRRLVCHDLSASGLFPSVYGVGVPGAGPPPPAAIRLDVHVRKMVWSRYLTYHGLSVAGCFLWPFGAPVSYGTVKIDFLVVATDAGGRELARREVAAEAPCTEWVYDQLYYKPQISEYRAAEMLPALLAQIRSIAAEAASRVP